MIHDKRALLLVALGVAFFTLTLSAQTFSPGDPVLVKLHDYHVGSILERSGTQYKVSIGSQSSSVRLLPPAQLIPLRKDWAIGDWILTDWTNERIFIRAQIVHVEAGRYLCIDWPQRAALWRDYWTLVPLAYVGVLGQHYDASLNFRKPEAAHIASDLPKSSQSSAPSPAIAAPPIAAASTLQKGDPILIEWRGTWYSGRLLEQKDGKYFVGYDGYSSSWNEWIGPERVRSADAAKTPVLAKNVGPDAKAGPDRIANGTVKWKIGDTAWNTFTNEGNYFLVKLLAYDGELWLCMEPEWLEVDWKKPEDLYADKPKQTFFPGK